MGMTEHTQVQHTHRPTQRHRRLQANRTALCWKRVSVQDKPKVKECDLLKEEEKKGFAYKTEESNEYPDILNFTVNVWKKCQH